MRTLALLIVLCCARVALAGDEPDTADGKAYFSDGTAAFSRGDYAAASRAFAAGYEVEKWNGFLFAWAQAERVAGHCEKAVELYSKFIWTNPAANVRDHALGWIKQCGGTYQEPPPEKPPEKPEKPPEKPEKPPEKAPKQPIAAPEPPGFQHKLAIGLGVVSLASAVVAIRSYTLAHHSFDASEIAFDYKDVAERRDQGDRRLLVARISGGLAVGLAAAAITRFVIHRSSKLEVVATPTGAGVAGRF